MACQQAKPVEAIRLVLTGNASNAIQTITSAIAAFRSIGTTFWTPLFLSLLARAYAELGQLHDASRCISEALTAVETTKERWSEAPSGAFH